MQRCSIAVRPTSIVSRVSIHVQRIRVCVRVSVARHQRDFVVILFVWKVMKKCLYNFTLLQWVGTEHKIIVLFAHNWSQLLEYDHVKSFCINQKNTSDEAHNTSTNTYGTKYRYGTGVLTTSPEFLGYTIHCIRIIMILSLHPFENQNNSRSPIHAWKFVQDSCAVRSSGD